jgi:cysteine-rich repeat protein
LGWAVALSLGCGSNRPAPELDRPGEPNPNVDAGSSGNGGSGGAGGGTDAAAPPGGGAGGSELAPDGGGPACGDGVLDPGEPCEPGLFTAPSCVQLGFDQGLLSCDTDCNWNTTGCSGTESCYDGRDNDGDSAVDCADAEDCAGACTDACFAPLLLGENSRFNGTLLGHPASSGASCGGAASSGPEVVYEVAISEDAKLDVFLSSTLPLSVSVRNSCGAPESELACGGLTRLTLDATGGDTYFIVVNAASESDVGEYELELAARQPACGDAIRDSHEACDDGNINDGDGCDPDCGLEASESEPNDALVSADVFDFEPWFAEISPAADEDYYRVTLVASSSTLVVETANLGDGACGLNLMDTVVDILDTNANANAILATDDDGGDGACARAVASGLPPGEYRVRVRAAASAQPATFPYRLDITVGVCGDGERTVGEECDDSNLSSGDGCDGTCREEP